MTTQERLVFFRELARQGGLARARNLTPEQRASAARKASLAAAQARRAKKLQRLEEK